jgi:hypothetical protein
MFYEIFDVFVDLSAVVDAEERMRTGMSGEYEIILHFADTEPLIRKMNSHVPADLLRSRQAMAQLGEALKTRPPFVRRASWPYSRGDMAFDLADVRAITYLSRDVKTTYETRHNRRPRSTVNMQYAVVIAGQPILYRKVQEYDIQRPPLQNEHDTLVKMWLRSLEREAA